MCSCSVTKERQWKRPSLPAGTAASDAAAAAAAATAATLASTTTTTSSSGGLTATSATPSASNDEKRRSKRLPSTPATASGDQPLPSGWREVLDKKSGRYYYVNEYVRGYCLLSSTSFSLCVLLCRVVVGTRRRDNGDVRSPMERRPPP